MIERVRVELVDLHATVHGLQRSLGPTLAAAAADGAIVEAGQDLDLVTQSLDGLSTFLGAVGRCLEAQGRPDAAGAAALVRLGGLSSRLAGRAGRGTQSGGRGELELF